MAVGDIITFNGNEDFRMRIVMSLLSGKPVRISGIRSTDTEPGLRGKMIYQYSCTAELVLKFNKLGKSSS